jgi:hypothetical protein
MAEEFNPASEGRRICREYLSRRGWSASFRRTTYRQVYPAFQREELEAKERQIDQREQEAEEIFSREVERLRADPSPQAKEVLQVIVEILGKRSDLGFFAQRIIERLKRTF